ncbi:MAG: heavy metal-associated domain-containing protein [candidate division KSB1 bacterium]
MKRFTLFAAVLGFALSGCDKPKEEASDNGSAAQVTLAGAGEVTINVPTIQCNSCAKNIEKALQGLDGVKSAKVNLGTKVAAVSFDADKLQLAEVEKAIAAAGYDANDTKREAAAYDALDACCKVPEDGGGH